MRSIRIRGVLAAAVVLGALAAPAVASAATAPDVTTGRATAIGQNGATLHGTIDPNGTVTKYFFQIGPTRLYGGETTAHFSGTGTKPRKTTALITAAAPGTTYHYRLVAMRGTKTWTGKDRTFKTKPQPLGVSLAATPNPISIGGSTTLAGVLSGTGKENRRVQLQSNVWPYTGGWVAAANDQFTSSTGSFSFPLLSVSLNTQYRVLMPTKPDVVSPIVVVGTVSKVTRHVTVRRGARRGRLHFTGRITPAIPGADVYVQKRRKGNWVNIKHVKAKDGGTRYSARVRQRHGGRYHVFVVDGSAAHSPGVSRGVRVRHVRF
jgi:hypothetical protein